MFYFRQDRSTNATRIARLPSWRRQLVETGAGVIDVLDIGEEKTSAIVLVTHGLGSLESFEEIADGLEHRFPGRRIVVYSRPGRGCSPALPPDEGKDLLAQEACEVIPALLTTLNIRTVDLVAHSDGVAVAMLFACAAPGQVGRIVAISPRVHADQHDHPTQQDTLTSFDCLAEIERLGAAHSDAALAMRCWAEARNGLAENPEMVLGQVETLSAPLLLIQGLRDDQGPEQQLAALSARVTGPMKWVILRQDGHYPQHDNTEVVIDLICGHLEEQPRTMRRTRSA